MWRFQHAKRIRSPGKPNHGIACARRAKHPRDLFDVNMIGDVVHADAPDKLRHGKAFQFEVETTCRTPKEPAQFPPFSNALDGGACCCHLAETMVARKGPRGG